jgi:hypothetical protein
MLILHFGPQPRKELTDLTLGSINVVFQRAQIVELAAKNRLPAIYHNSQFAEAGERYFMA